MIVILSPHLDDAVLSCWSVLTGDEPAIVANVFTGAPRAGSGARWWDRMTGAVDSADRMRERQAEDRAALALAGREALQLGLLEAQYRQEVDVDLVDTVRGAIALDAQLLAPAAMGGHPDHVLVRDAALALARDGADVGLYADLPHAIPRGWPTWVADRDGVPAVDAEWRGVLAVAGVDDAPARVRRLGHEDLARKVEALRAYRTQYAALDALAFRPLLNPATLRYEVFWPLG